MHFDVGYNPKVTMIIFKIKQIILQSQTGLIEN